MSIGTVDQKCEIDNYGYCADNSSGGPKVYEKCEFNSLYTECKPINKDCREIRDTTKCSECKISVPNTVCSNVENYGCNNVEINELCKIENGKCVLKEESDSGKCHFNSTNNGCEYLTVDSSNCVLGADFSCTDGTGLTDKDKNKCDFVDKGKARKNCESRAKICSDYTNENECNALDNCVYTYSNYLGVRGCYKVETDGNCQKKNDGSCSPIEGKISKDEKCELKEEDDYTFKCQKKNKYCIEYEEKEDCLGAPEDGGGKCYYFPKVGCIWGYTDGNCIFNSEGKCVEDGTGKLSQNEICILDDNDGDEYFCEKRIKLCSEIDSNSCDNHSPEVKLCFYFYEFYCDEVKVDSQCKMNENNECTGNNCQFDEDRERCYYQEKGNDGNDGSLLKMKQYILLMLFFVL